MSGHFQPLGDTSGLKLSAVAMPDSGSKRSVFIATTALWDIDPHFFQCCLRAQQTLLTKGLTGKGVISGRFPEVYAGESPVGRSRNSLTATFLASDCSDLLFIDSDLVFSAEQIERIVQHEEDVVGGCYLLKKEGFPQVCNNRKPGILGPRPDGLMEVNYIGTGFLRVRRSVFEKMIAHYADEMWYTTDDGSDKIQYDFWKMGVYSYPDGTRRWLSEDWWFCQRCQDLGIPVYADLNILLGHSGHAVYPLQSQLDHLYPKRVSSDAKEAELATASAAATSPAVAPVQRFEVPA